MSSSFLQSLPPEILYHTVTFLDSQSLLNLSCSTRQFQWFYHIEQLWKQQLQRDFDLFYPYKFRDTWYLTYRVYHQQILLFFRQRIINYARIDPQFIDWNKLRPVINKAINGLTQLVANRKIYNPYNYDLHLFNNFIDTLFTTHDIPYIDYLEQFRYPFIELLHRLTPSPSNSNGLDS